jgi:hypothetical protein
LNGLGQLLLELVVVKQDQVAAAKRNKTTFSQSLSKVC